MTLNIAFDESSQIFHLHNNSISYMIELLEDKYLAHRYWGPYIKQFDKLNQKPLKKRTFSSRPEKSDEHFSLEFVPQEFPISYQGDYKESALEVTFHDNSHVFRLTYSDYQIITDSPDIAPLPHARKNRNSHSKTLVINLIDEITHIQVNLYYTIFENYDALIRSSEVINLGKKSLIIDQLMSASLDQLYSGQEVISFYGSHQAEFQKNNAPIQHGQFITGTSRGSSGPQYVPFIAVGKNADEQHGQIHAMTLLYSGNHRELIERDQYDQLRLQIGLNPSQFSCQLAEQESFQSPQALLVYSKNGFNGMSKVFHSFNKNHISPPNQVSTTKPILINSWEMTYFEVNEALMLKLIDQASQLGFEAVVLDDGWFKGRNSSKTSLGDWQVDQSKFPNGLEVIVEKCRQKKLKFGIWFEPEMISPESDLYTRKTHWIVKAPHHAAHLGRNQYVLDLTQNEAQQFLLNTMREFIYTYKPDYIKWDMNRHIVEPFSQISEFLPKEFSHRYMIKLYEILDQLTTEFPEIIFENCSSGSGRLDFGMLYYFPQTWASDNTDALDRQKIQYGASYLFHPYQLTGHVSDVPNHQTNRITPIQTRMNLASSTNMGYELNILTLSDEDKRAIKNHLNQYKAQRDLIQNGSFYRLCSPFESNITAWLFESKAKDEILLFVFKNCFNITELNTILTIPYADPTAEYIDSNGYHYFGDELKYSGLSIPFEKGDFQSYSLHLKKLN